MKKSTKEPNLFLALVPIISMFLLLSLGLGIYKLPPEPLILVSTLIAGVVAISLGYSFDDIMVSVSEKIGKVMPAILILITVGFLIGAWMIGGTIPMLIYYGLKLINPQFIFVTSFLVTAIIAIFTGTSWGAVGTIGVAFMGVAIGIDTNLSIIAGAVVSGAYFGDKLSPLSDTTNLASLSTGVNLYEHIKHMLFTTVPSFILAGSVYTIIGFILSNKKSSIPENVNIIMSTLNDIFTWNLLYLVPLFIILYGSIRKKPTIPIMLISSFFAMANGMIFEHFSLNNVIVATLDGFNISMVSDFDTKNVANDIPELLNRGGMMSMMNTLLIAIVAITFAGTMMVSNSLNIIIHSLLKLVQGTLGLISTTILICLTTIGVTSNGQISILIPGESLRDAFIKQGLHPKNLSRTIEDSVSIVEPILPWTAAGAYMAGTLGVATLSYLPWAILNYSGIAFALICAGTGFGITKLNTSQK